MNEWNYDFKERDFFFVEIDGKKRIDLVMIFTREKYFVFRWIF